MILHLSRTLVALDLETDGDGTPEEQRPVEVAVLIVRPDGSEEPHATLVNPERPIPARATKVHGITDVRVSGCANCGAPLEGHPVGKADGSVEALCVTPRRVPTFAQIAPRLAPALTGVDFCGYNVRYDLRVLAGAFKRAGVAWSADGARLLDAHALWQLARPRALGDAVREWLGREPTDAHRAMGDARDALAVSMAILERVDALPRDIARLHEMCFTDRNVDPAGKFVWRDGEAVCNFGKKHHGRRLREIPRDYLEWMMKDTFPPETKVIVREALAGRFPVKP